MLGINLLLLLLVVLPSLCLLHLPQSVPLHPLLHTRSQTKEVYPSSFYLLVTAEIFYEAIVHPPYALSVRTIEVSSLLSCTAVFLQHPTSNMHISNSV